MLIGWIWEAIEIQLADKAAFSPIGWGSAPETIVTTENVHSCSQEVSFYFYCLYALIKMWELAWMFFFFQGQRLKWKRDIEDPICKSTKIIFPPVCLSVVDGVEEDCESWHSADRLRMWRRKHQTRGLCEVRYVLYFYLYILFFGSTFSHDNILFLFSGVRWRNWFLD